MRDRLEQSVVEAFPWVRINGHREKRLPNTSSVSFRGLEANTILSELSGVAASAGAACHADGVEISSVLRAMNVPADYAMGTVRFSTGRFTTADEIDRAVEEIKGVVSRLAPPEETSSAGIPAGEVKLTRYTRGLGCACKLRPQLLEQVLGKIPAPADERILVGIGTSDDAAVYRIDDRTAIVQTVDFFTPIVDDPFEFGAISAANSLSDVYAMGARPLFALSVVGFPVSRLPIEVLDRILAGARSKTDEAGISIIGGHTVDDTEPKFGLAVTGIVHPRRLVANSTARPGDTLFLTKPIGTGILSTALKRGILGDDRAKVLAAAMAALNRAASEAMQETGVSACTDVTGFGLLGHLLEMMKGSNTTAVVSASRVPLLDGVVEAAAAGAIPGGTRDNLSHTEGSTEYGEGVSGTMKLVLNDAQTSGGLLISVEKGGAESLGARLDAAGVRYAVIGEVVAARAKRIFVTS
jgi:selenium donor protein